MSATQSPTVLERAGHLTLEAYSLLVHSTINGAISTLLIGTGSFVVQRYLFRMDATVSKSFEFAKLMGCDAFSQSLFSPLERILASNRKVTFEELSKEGIPPQNEPDWRKGALEVMLFAVTFFPRAYITFQLANRIGCMGATIEGQKNSLKSTFYFFTAMRLLSFINLNLPRFLDDHRNPKQPVTWKMRLPGEA